MTTEQTPAQIWQAALGEIQLQVNKPNYNTWFKNTAGIALRDGELVVGVPNTFVAEYLDRNQRSLIEKVLTGIVRREIRIAFDIASGPATRTVKNARQQAALPLFNPRYTFDSFIPGSGNQLAYAAALKVVEKPGTSYNPLFIHGGPGVGKTHLLQAIGQAAVKDNIKVVYVSAEQYTNELMTALREGTMEQFRGNYRSADMLLIDDVQFFSGKKQTETSFFHTFDELHNANHQIAVTSDRPPKSIPFVQEKLCSRLEWGLVTDIQPPDFDTRLAILQAKVRREGTSIPPEALEVIALNIQQNIRVLEGALNRIVAYAKLLRTNLTPELAVQALKDIDSTPKALPVSPSHIIEAVVNSFQVTPSDLKGRKKDEATVLARQVAMYLIRQETEYSLSEVGEMLGGRSPATISHAYQKIAQDINNNPPLKRKIFDIQQKVYASVQTANGGK